MNKTSLINRLKKLNEEYPVDKCKYDGSAEERNNAQYHADKMYEMSCCISRMVGNGFLSTRTARSYGEILRQFEYHPGESGQGHFPDVFGCR